MRSNEEISQIISSTLSSHLLWKDFAQNDEAKETFAETTMTSKADQYIRCITANFSFSIFKNLSLQRGRHLVIPFRCNGCIFARCRATSPHFAELGSLWWTCIIARIISRNCNSLLQSRLRRHANFGICSSLFFGIARRPTRWRSSHHLTAFHWQFVIKTRRLRR